MDTGLDNNDLRISHFFSNIGPGMLCGKSDNLSVNFAPAALN
jgi:hypothetical protein